MNEWNVSEKAFTAIQREKMLCPMDTVLVALSGGADSMTLLFVLRELSERLNLAGIVAAHVNHGLRGEEAERDEKFVREQCNALGVEVFVQHADVNALAAASGMGIEETGRQVRYAFFDDIASRFEHVRIATAHTLSDAMETVLHNLVRGCGLNGLCGIPPVRGNVIRPLIDCTRQEIEEYCHGHSISYVCDSTNTDTQYTRNRIRSCIVPQLYTINSRADAAFQRIITVAHQDEAYLQEQAKSMYACMCENEKAGEYERKSFCTLPPALCTRVLRLAAEAAGGTGIEQRHIEQMEQLLKHNGAVTLPGKIKVDAHGEKINFSLIPSQIEPNEFHIDLKPGNSYEICGRKYQTSLLSLDKYEKEKKVHKKLLKNVLNYDKIRNHIIIRQRISGDSYHPVNRQGSKSLKKLFNEAKMPLEQRAVTPVLCDEQGIVLVYGFGCDERVKVNSDTKCVLTFMEIDEN